MLDFRMDLHLPVPTTCACGTASPVNLARGMRVSPELKRLAIRCASKIAYVATLSPSESVAEKLCDLRLSSALLRNTSQGADSTTGTTQPPKYDERSTESLLRAYGVILKQVNSHGATKITLDAIRSWNRLATEGNLKEGSLAVPGAFRTHELVIQSWRAPHWQNAPSMMVDLVEWLHDAAACLIPENALANAIAKAIVAHAQLVYIHPFGDGNGRTARLLQFAMLLHAGVPPFLAQELSNHYNESRGRYCATLAAKNSESVYEFLKYSLEGLQDRIDAKAQLCMSDKSMSRRAMLRAGYSLLEVLASVTILGVIAAVVIQRISVSRMAALQAAEATTVRNIRFGIEQYRIVNAFLPSALDSLSNFVGTTSSVLVTVGCSPGSPCFGAVLGVGCTDGSWQKVSPNQYTGPTGKTYSYDPSTGRFQ